LSKSEKKFIVAVRKGHFPVEVVCGSNYASMGGAQRRANQLTKQFAGTDRTFMVKEKDWRRKRLYS
jgi:hypothetical protein